MDWAGAVSTSSNTLAAGVSVASWLLDPQVVRTVFTDPTLTRSIVGFSAGSQAASASPILGAMGIIAWPSRDATIPAAPPRPYTDTALDWIYWCPLLAPGSTATAIMTSIFMSTPAELIDARAQRKLGSDYGVLICVELAASSQPIQWNVAARLLIKE